MANRHHAPIHFGGEYHRSTVTPKVVAGPSWLRGYPDIIKNGISQDYDTVYMPDK